ncbi:hypothetical protein [Aureibacter tunicatorum]|uniref:Lipoprotein n=1 Tax=Aureibacter tunicatorum TaxID=866807 RepID=A0AAE3XR86_9BACT|nr:hypothetical protein [Aureibacter tunicatorum]MDR6240578.1 hypothetical protein [Aureibacter tunicatorum]BDD06561.1 hypothetical protein AUTU_40440 [Aureibacter tunicatorum]
MKNVWFTVRLMQLSAIFLFYGCNVNSELKRLEAGYDNKINLIQEMDRFEAKLITLGELDPNFDYKENFFRSYSMIEISHDSIMFDNYLPRGEYLKCLENIDVNKMNSKAYKYYYLTGLYLKIQSRLLASINVKIDENSDIWINDKLCQLDSFAIEYEVSKQKLVSQNIPAEDITIQVHIDSNVKMGVVNDIQNLLKDLKK